MPSAAKQCYKASSPSIGTSYEIFPQSGTINAWWGEIAQFDQDAFAINFNEQDHNNVQINSVQVSNQAYTYVIIFQYASGSKDYVYINSNDNCYGMAMGATIEIPQQIFVARAN
jgi:hypothetical protein